MKKQKILVLCPIFPPHRFGGLEKIAFEVAKKLARTKKIYVVTSQLEFGKELPSYQHYHGMHVYRVPRCCVDFPDFNFTEIIHKNTLFLETAVKIFKKNPDISVIHAHDWFVGMAAMSFKNLFSVPLITTFHGCKQLEHQEDLTMRHKYIIQIQKQLLACSNAVTTYSEFMRETLLEIYHCPEDKIEVFRCGIDEMRTVPERKKRFGKKILYFGRFAPEKNVENLLAAFKIVLDDIPDARLSLVGRGCLKNEYVEIINRLKIGKNAKIYDFVSDPEKTNEIFNRHDVFVLPSLFEPFGITVLEAMARKLPVVATNRDGPGEIIKDNVTGLKIDPENPKDIAEKIVYLLKDKKISQRLAESAYLDVKERYNWEMASKFFEELYQKKGKHI